MKSSRQIRGTTSSRLRGILALAVLAVSTPCLASLETPYTPSNDDVVLQTVPSRTDPRVRAFDALRKDLAQHPADTQRALALARAYTEYAQGTGDARYLGRAEAVIAPWLAQQPIAVPMLLLHATILQSRHFFAVARVLLQEIVRRDPENDQAWLTLATVAQVQGDMAGARSACAHLLGSSNALIPGGCLASLSAVDGHADAAWKTLQVLLPQLRGATPAEQSWIQGVMADTAIMRGDAVGAEAHFRAALQATPGDNFTLADYADFMLDEQRPAQALELVKDYSTSDTSFLRQVLAELALNLPQAQTDKSEMARRWAAIDRRGSRTYGREEAMFTLHAEHDAKRALALAQENWNVQRAPKDARILLEAALASNQPDAAQPVLDLLAQTRLEDPRVNALARRVKAALASRSTPAAGSAPTPTPDAAFDSARGKAQP